MQNSHCRAIFFGWIFSFAAWIGHSYLLHHFHPFSFILWEICIQKIQRYGSLPFLDHLQIFSEGHLSNFIPVLVIDGSVNLIIWTIWRLIFWGQPLTEELGKWCNGEVLPGCFRASCDPGSQQGDTSTGQGMMGMALDRNGWNGGFWWIRITMTYLLVIQSSYWFIVSFPIQNGDLP